jgi:hypothetical protein
MKENGDCLFKNNRFEENGLTKTHAAAAQKSRARLMRMPSRLPQRHLE